jgi:hypothetical protein
LALRSLLTAGLAWRASCQGRFTARMLPARGLADGGSPGACPQAHSDAGLALHPLKLAGSHVPAVRELQLPRPPALQLVDAPGFAAALAWLFFELFDQKVRAVEAGSKRVLPLALTWSNTVTTEFITVTAIHWS